MKKRHKKTAQRKQLQKSEEADSLASPEPN